MAESARLSDDICRCLGTHCYIKIAVNCRRYLERDTGRVFADFSVGPEGEETRIVCACPHWIKRSP